MRNAVLIPLLAAALTACGGSDKPPATPTPTATPADALAGYSEGVRSYYGGAAADPHGGVEAEYHQPPKPAEATVGEPITLTGSNIGVRMDVTVTGTRTVRVSGEAYTAVELELESTGITVYEGELRNATLTYPEGDPLGVAEGVRAPCSNGLDTAIRVDVGDTLKGCLVFPAQSDVAPERLQLALETVPAEAGGIWTL
jgi:hypothetical protein